MWACSATHAIKKLQVNTLTNAFAVCLLDVYGLPHAETLPSWSLCLLGEKIIEFLRGQPSYIRLVVIADGVYIGGVALVKQCLNGSNLVRCW
jgi:hypothetical protein